MIVQIIGFLGLAAYIASYQMKSNKALYITQMTGVLLFTLQFAFLGAISGCLSLALTAIRNIMLTKYNDWKWVRSKVWPVVLCILFTVVMVLTWAGPVSILAYIASVVSTLLYWTNNARNLRIANLFVSSPCWIIYDCIVKSYGGIVSEAFTMVSIVISIIRFGWKNLGQSKFDLTEEEG